MTENPVRETRRKAKAQLDETLADARELFAPATLSNLVRKRFTNTVTGLAQKARTSLSNHKGTIAGVATGVGLLILAKPLSKTLRSKLSHKRKQETDNV